MQALIYYLTIPFIYLISILPFWVLYRVSDFLYILVFYVLKYRKEMVFRNMKKAFPNKSDAEIMAMRKNFYHFFTDIIVETFKIFTISADQVKKRSRITDLSVIEEIEREGKDYLIVTGHYGNWELAGASISLSIKNLLYVLYKPLSNKYFDRLIYNSRIKFGTKLISVKNSFERIKSLIGKKSVFAFISDQAARPERAYWTVFLNQDAPVFMGAELIAKKYNLPIVYVSIKRVKRGYYEVNFEKLFDNPKQTKKGEITEKYTKRIEQDIIENPEIWLWTHNRWKHKKPEIQNKKSPAKTV